MTEHILDMPIGKKEKIMKNHASKIVFTIALLLLGGSLFGANITTKSESIRHQNSAITTSSTLMNFVEKKDWRELDTAAFAESNISDVKSNLTQPDYTSYASQTCVTCNASQTDVRCCSTQVELQKTLLGGANYAILDLYRLFTPELINFYEENISKDNFISSIRPNKLKRMADKLNIPTKKMIVILLMQDVAARTGVTLDMKDLAVLSDSEMLKYGTQYVKAFIETLSDIDKEALRIKFQQLKK